MAKPLSQLLTEDRLKSLKDKRTPVQGDSYPDLLFGLYRLNLRGEPHALLASGALSTPEGGAVDRVIWIETLAAYEQVMSRAIRIEFFAVSLRDLAAFFEAKN